MSFHTLLKFKAMGVFGNVRTAIRTVARRHTQNDAATSVHSVKENPRLSRPESKRPIQRTAHRDSFINTDTFILHETIIKSSVRVLWLLLWKTSKNVSRCFLPESEYCYSDSIFVNSEKKCLTCSAMQTEFIEGEMNTMRNSLNSYNK